MARVDVDAIRRNPTHLLLLLKGCGLVHTGSTGWRSKCPIHQGERLSFSVFRARDGAFLWNCFVCNESGDAVKLVQLLDGLSWKAAAQSFDTPEQRERVYIWSPKPEGRKSGKNRTKVTVTVPCEEIACRAELHLLLDDLTSLAEGHPAWDFEIKGLLQVWAWCPTHHRSGRTGRQAHEGESGLCEADSLPPVGSSSPPCARNSAASQAPGGSAQVEAEASPQTCVAPDLSTVAHSDASNIDNERW